MMKSIPLFLAILSLSSSMAQVLNFEWVGTLQSPNITNCTGMTIDKNENVISAGWFQNTQDFDPGPGTFNMNSPQENIFIQKLDASGNFVWAGQLTSIGINRAHAIACDTSANIFICGHLNSAADIDPGPGTFTLTPSIGNQTFIAKYDPNGLLLWAYILPGQSVANYRREIICTPDGSVLIPGYFGGTQDFDPGAGTYALTAGTDVSAFVVKLDHTGSFVWARSLSGESTEAYGVGLYPNGDILINGMFTGTVDFDPGVGIVNGSNSGNFTDGFALKLSASGDYIWSKLFLGNDDTKMFTLDVNTLGQAFIAAEFKGTIDIDPGVSTDLKTAAGGEDVFMTVLDASGNYLWGHSFGGNFNEKCTFISSDNVGNWYVTGTFVGDVDMQPGAGTQMLSSITYDMYLCKYTPSGVIEWLTKIEGTSNVDYSVAIYRSATGNVYLAGDYDDNIDFDPGSGLAEYACIGGEDCFAMKFNECTPAPPVPVIADLPDLTVECSFTPSSYPEATEACYGTITGVPDLSFPITDLGLSILTWTYDVGNGNITTQTQNITIIDTTAPQPSVANLPDVNAVCSINALTPPTATDNCSGTVTVTNDASLPILSNTTVTWTYDDGNGNTTTQQQQVNIQSIDNSVNQMNAITLTASATGYSYQWLDCNNGNAPINGETAQTFVATANGSYAVEISNGVCTVTSDCITISEVGLAANADALNWFVAPNPSFDGVFTVQMPNSDSETTITVLNELGQVVDYTAESTESGYTIRLSAKNGVYFLRMTTSEQTVLLRLVKG